MARVHPTHARTDWLHTTDSGSENSSTSSEIPDGPPTRLPPLLGGSAVQPPRPRRESLPPVRSTPPPTTTHRPPPQHRRVSFTDTRSPANYEDELPDLPDYYESIGEKRDLVAIIGELDALQAYSQKVQSVYEPSGTEVLLVGQGREARAQRGRVFNHTNADDVPSAELVTQSAARATFLSCGVHWLLVLGATAAYIVLLSLVTREEFGLKEVRKHYQPANCVLLELEQTAGSSRVRVYVDVFLHDGDSQSQTNNTTNSNNTLPDFHAAVDTFIGFTPNGYKPGQERQCEVSKLETNNVLFSDGDPLVLSEYGRLCGYVVFTLAWLTTAAFLILNLYKPAPLTNLHAFCLLVYVAGTDVAIGVCAPALVRVHLPSFYPLRWAYLAAIILAFALLVTGVAATALLLYVCKDWLWKPDNWCLRLSEPLFPADSTTPLANRRYHVLLQ